ncbi:MAG: 26S protease regulatory subunit [Synergistaceae bacterium]|nr:26S protease regulatory subunit [Synergistaceae bacterium]
MKICVCIRGRLLNSPYIQERVQTSFALELRRFYRIFTRFDVIFREGYSEVVDVFVMGSARSFSSETASEIITAIRRIIHTAYGAEANVRLGWQGMPVDFSPPRTVPASPKSEDLKEFDYEHLVLNYKAESPRYSFTRVVLPAPIMTQIRNALAVIQVEAKVFDEWGLRNIMPFATCAMSFYGPPGTGKSMAAEAIADELGKKIIRASYADIVSKYKGQGQKMVKALFLAAEKQDAVLFIDEAEALLSKRFADAGDSSSESSNAMKSQMLILLEQFSGTVIFATNMPQINDKAFNSRLVNIKFTLPDSETRREIWEQHIRGEGIRIPLSDGVNTSELAERYELCGRDIKKAVRDACVTAAINGKDTVAQEDFVRSCEQLISESKNLYEAEDYTASKREPIQLSDGLKRVIREKIIPSS